ncbi:MAG: hypothetical protein FVQ82_07875 [Planctomycetes bacterium]|nr:hypothetical protein [Planctomycetota bacterium]
MITKQDIFKADNEKLPELKRTVLIEQIKWLIKLRWFAVAGIVVSSLVCTYIFDVLPEVNIIHKCALFLLIFSVYSCLLVVLVVLTVTLFLSRKY